MHDVVGVGTNSVDHVLVTRTGLTDAVASGKGRIEARHLFCGGQTATTMCACSAFGLSAGYIGVFGADEGGRMARRTLEKLGVTTTDSSVADDVDNRTAVIVLDGDGCRTVFWHRPETLSIDLQQLNERSLRARVVHVDDDDAEAALRAATIARGLGTPVTSDIEHANDRTESLIAAVTFPIFNEELPLRLTGERDPERALRKLRRLNPGTLCVTLGARGAAALEGDRFHLVPAFDVEVVDDTGAGDMFRAGFIYGVLNSWPVLQTLRFANAAAALACTRLGAISSVPSLSDVNRLLT